MTYAVIFHCKRNEKKVKENDKLYYTKIVAGNQQP